MYSSKSRPPEQLQRDLESMGYDKVTVEVEGEKEPEPAPEPETAPESPESEPTAAEEPEAAEPVAEPEKPSESAPEKIREKSPAKTPAEKPEPAGEPAEKTPDSVSEPADKAAAADAVPVERKARNSRERKIQKLEVQIEVDRLERERMARELAELKARGADPKPAAAEKPKIALVPEPEPEPPIPEAKPRPKHGDFFDAEDPVESFAVALVEWEVDERERKRRQSEVLDRAKADSRKRQEEDMGRRTAAEEQAKIAQAAQEDWNHRVAEARKELPDFDQVLSTPGDLCSSVMHQVAYNSDYGPEIKYWLGKHPDQASKLCAETQTPKGCTAEEYRKSYKKAERFLSKIEDEIEAERAKKPAKTAAAQLPPDDDDDEDEQDLPVATPVAAAAVPASEPPPSDKPKAAAAVAPTPPAATPPPSAPQLKAVPKKHTPVTPVGSRGSAVNKSVTEMDPKALREMSQADFRKMRGM